MHPPEQNSAIWWSDEELAFVPEVPTRSNSRETLLNRSDDTELLDEEIQISVCVSLSERRGEQSNEEVDGHDGNHEHKQAMDEHDMLGEFGVILIKGDHVEHDLK